MRDRLPVVFAGRPLRQDDREAPTVDVDNVGAAKIAMTLETTFDSADPTPENSSTLKTSRSAR